MQSLTIAPGTPTPYGATENNQGINFSIYAKEAEKVTLCLFNEDEREHPFKEIELDPLMNRTGDVWHVHVVGLPPYTLYSYRIQTIGMEEPSPLLLDPYAKTVISHPQWRENPNDTYHPFGLVDPATPFDWQGDRFQQIPLQNLMIYEMHLRGFTIDRSSETQHPGTYLGLIEKIPYLKELGINAIELLPVHEFDETEALQVNPTTEEKLCNYWGYSTVNFFSPMSRYATKATRDQAVFEFKTMVRELHKAGIAVILDVVYNHTAEGNELGRTLSFKGLDPTAYYMINEQGHYLNFSGCGNTFNANHPIARELILNSLRYWITEMHVDGFRLDLASILTRDSNGTPLGNPPLVEAISMDPILSHTILIAEAWDAAGLYQVGRFYPGVRWSEWNGRYRDVVRRFIKGTPSLKKAFATAICGSQDLYGWGKSPLCSVNFITSHDGFSMADLVSYNEKHNEDNGEGNRDGFDHNDSWNCGIEGHSTNKKIVYLRERQIRNFFLTLMISQGIPMILMGDEYAHTRHGNNNTWCQDNELNWFLWNKLDVRPGFHRFCRSLIHFRKNHPLLGRKTFLGDKDITWHGLNPLKPDWDNDNRCIAFTLNNTDKSSSLYVAFNSSNQPLTLNLPPAGPGKKWFWIVNTHFAPPDDFFDEGHRPRLDLNFYRIHSHSAILLEAKPDIDTPPSLMR